MVAFGTSSMVGDNKIGAKAVLLVIWIHFLITGAAAIPHEKLDDMIPVLRRRGYNRFGNAINTSDLIKDCLALDNLTLFAPTDESMAMAHSSYISGVRSHAVPRRLAVSDLILLPPSTILPTLLPNHTVSITVRGTRTTVHVAVNGVPLESPGLYYSRHVVVHGLAGALIPRSHFPSCCLPQSPIRATLVQTPSLTGPDALLRSQSAPQASSNGDLLPPHPPETLAADISVAFSISSTAAAVTAVAIAFGVIIHLFRPRQNLAPLDDMDDPQQDLPPFDDIDGVHLIIQMILNTLRQQGLPLVQINYARIMPVTVQLGLRLKRCYTSRLEILSQPQYIMHRTPDDVIMVIELPDGCRLHLGQVPHYFMNGRLYANSYVFSIRLVDITEIIPIVPAIADVVPADIPVLAAPAA